MKNKGLAMMLVLATLMVVVILANIVLNIISSQSRLTLHQLSRIQAYYAAWAGVNYAYEKLGRNNDPNWPRPTATNTPYTRELCNWAGTTNTCIRATAGGGDINEAALPFSVLRVLITVRHASICNPPAGAEACISATADYTYTPPS